LTASSAGAPVQSHTCRCAQLSSRSCMWAAVWYVRNYVIGSALLCLLMPGDGAAAPGGTQKLHGGAALAQGFTHCQGVH
jgi:hypothetical protein